MIRAAHVFYPNFEFMNSLKIKETNQIDNMKMKGSCNHSDWVNK